MLRKLLLLLLALLWFATYLATALPAHEPHDDNVVVGVNDNHGSHNEIGGGEEDNANDVNEEDNDDDDDDDDDEDGDDDHEVDGDYNEEPLPPTATSQDILDWLMEEYAHDGFFVSDKLVEHDHSWWAAKDIQEGELLLHIPSSAILADEYVDHPHFEMHVCDTAVKLVTEYLLAEENDDDEGESFFADYVNYLMETPELVALNNQSSSSSSSLLPIYWSEEVKNWVQSKIMGDELEIKEFGYTSLYTEACVIDEEYSTYSFEKQDLLQRALHLVQWRGWNNNKLMIPTLDWIAHSQSGNVQELSSPPRSGATGRRGRRPAVRRDYTLVASRNIASGEGLRHSRGSTLHWFNVRGVVEPYPRRFSFETGHDEAHGFLVFDVDYYHHDTDAVHDDNDSTKQQQQQQQRFQVTWIRSSASGRPSLVQQGWLQAHEQRMRALVKQGDELFANAPPSLSREQRVMVQDYQAAVLEALQQALLWVHGDPYQDERELTAQLALLQEEQDSELKQQQHDDDACLVPQPEQQRHETAIATDGVRDSSSLSHVAAGMPQAEDPEDQILASNKDATDPKQRTTLLPTKRSSSLMTDHPPSSRHYDSLEPRLAGDALEGQYNQMKVSHSCSAPHVRHYFQAEFVDHLSTMHQDMEWTHFPDEERPEKRDSCLRLDGILHSCTSIRPHVHETIVHYPASFLPKDSIKRVLFVGGGDLIILHEILKYPSIELVIGMELDQAVVRNSFRHYGVQPHFDDERVHWWFGDASKSLTMLPPEYMGTFDLVFIDLLSFIFDSIRVNGDTMLIDYMMQLVQPNGILIRQEDFVERSYVGFAKHTVDLDLYGLPYVCQQSFTMGSNTIDFANANRTDHNIETLFYQPNDSNHSKLWAGYRTNHKVPVARSEPAQTAPLQARHGILTILEAESVKSPLHDLSEVRANIDHALKKADLVTTGDPLVLQNDNTLVFVFDEGYAVARTWPEQRYCAFDLQLWNSIEKQRRAAAELIDAVGGSCKETTSFYHITTGGMFGLSQTKTEHEQVQNSTETTQSASVEHEWKADASLENQGFSATLQALAQLTQLSAPVIAVMCGDSANMCQSLDSVKDFAHKVVPLWQCPSILVNATRLAQQSRHERSDMPSCENQVQGTLRDGILGAGGTIDLIVIDPNAPKELGQVVHKIFNNSLTRRELLSDGFVVLAPTTAASSTTSWRTTLLHLFRTQIVRFNPVVHARAVFGTSLEMEILSAGDNNFYSHLIEASHRVTEITGMSFELRQSKVGLARHVPDYEPSVTVWNDDYDVEAARRQWLSQNPLGHQLIAQFEIQPPRPIEKGAIVLVNIHMSPWNGQWTTGRVLEPNDNRTYTVEFGSWGRDGEWVPGHALEWRPPGRHKTRPQMFTNVDRSMIRLIDSHSAEAPLHFGEHLLHRWTDPKTRHPHWFQGMVTEIRVDGTYKVQSFEGDNEMLVMERSELIRLMEQSHTSYVPTLSCATFQGIVEDALHVLEDWDSKTSFAARRTGVGCVITTVFDGGSVVAVWDGRTRMDFNLFQQDGLGQEIQTAVERVFLNAIPFLKVIQHDAQPRGSGRVVCSRERIDKSMWFGGITGLDTPGAVAAER